MHKKVRFNRLTKGASTGVSMSEELTYDVMDNIETLARDGGNPNWYDYPNGNQLWYVGNVTDGYEYDANGNAIVDGRLHFNVEYNQLNLPKRISSINLNYTYDATGRKLRKNSNNSVRNYIDGIEYKPEGTIDFIQTEEGIAQNNGSNECSYRYNLSDHLGNVRATFYFNPANNNQLEVIQRDDYYAFGMRKKGSPSSLVNKYLYNGKELQEELGDQYDYSSFT
ncbi:RHS repeat domain-containing protein [Pedobacter sp. AW1-32]|uniref:RHS repeat domain-containing protein n=1 Tax=Pedobacter sp. AW1-32 TaxID=3383026 RepID=UPI003FEFA131